MNRKLNEETKNRIEDCFWCAMNMTKDKYYDADYEVRKEAVFPFFFGVLEANFRTELNIDLEAIWQNLQDIKFHDDK